MIRLRTRLAMLTALAALAAACAQASDDEAAPSDEEMLTAGAAAYQACGATFQPAFKHYKAAVTGAQARLAGHVCESDGMGMRQEIANEAATAVMTCSAFKDVVRTSPFAEPIRKTLADSLTLKALTGELLVLRDSEFQNWRGVEALLPGLTMSTTPEGAVGAHAFIEFKANGVATYNVFDLAPPNYELPATKTTQATYKVDKTGGDADPRTVTVTRADGKSVKFRLGVGKLPAQNFSSAPIFQLVPISGDTAAFTALGHDTFVSIVGECSI